MMSNIIYMEITMAASACVLLTLVGGDQPSCGGQVRGLTSGTIESPVSPHNLTHCIWLLEVEAGMAVQMTLWTKSPGHGNGAMCSDFIEVRAGSSIERVLYNGCADLSAFTVVSNTRWLWFRYYADDEQPQYSFTAHWMEVAPWTNLNYTEKRNTEACYNQFRCSNGECVSYSWVCDGYYDCGCTSGCDEDTGCSTVTIETRDRLIMGTVMGVVIFCLALVAVAIMDRKIPIACLIRYLDSRRQPSYYRQKTLRVAEINEHLRQMEQQLQVMEQEKKERDLKEESQRQEKEAREQREEEEKQKRLAAKYEKEEKQREEREQKLNAKAVLNKSPTPEAKLTMTTLNPQIIVVQTPV